MAKSKSTHKDVKALLAKIHPEFRQERRGHTHVFVYAPNGVDIAHGSLSPGTPAAVRTFRQRLRAIGALPEEA